MFGRLKEILLLFIIIIYNTLDKEKKYVVFCFYTIVTVHQLLLYVILQEVDLIWI